MDKEILFTIDFGSSYTDKSMGNYVDDFFINDNDELVAYFCLSKYWELPNSNRIGKVYILLTQNQYHQESVKISFKDNNFLHEANTGIKTIEDPPGSIISWIKNNNNVGWLTLEYESQ